MIASARQTEPVAITQRSRGRSIALIVGFWIAVVVGGIVLATVGNALREPSCIGGGSECAGAKAPADDVGDALYYFGTAITFASPLLVAGGVALRRRAGTKYA